MKHLLVTNDFPPKIGGIQSYLWELWRRLPVEDIAVLTTPYNGDSTFDSSQAYSITRTKQKWLLPTRALADQINNLAHEHEADFIVLDPVFPMGLVAPRLNKPYVLIGHGAEFTIPRRFPVIGRRMNWAAQGAIGLIGGGKWVEAAMFSSADGQVPSINIPPGVDVNRFQPLGKDERARCRQNFGITDDQTVILGVSRLVPRKGFDRLIRASASLALNRPNFHVLIAGRGREAAKLQRLINKLKAPVTMLGSVSDEDLPSLYASADVFCMPCHDRWFGVESEGFGIVFVEAAASGLPSIAGLSGGSAEAVVDGKTGFVVDGRVSCSDVEVALERVVDDQALRRELGSNARLRAAEFDYDDLAQKLKDFFNRIGKTPVQ